MFATAALSAAATLAACASTAGAPPATESSPAVERAWVWILTGPRDDEVRDPARSLAFAGHFANMTKMAERGDLLVAGPFGEPRARDDHRGIFVLATGDLDEAREVAASDPTSKAGVFTLAVEPFRTTDELERLNAMHTAALEASGISNPPPGAHCRTYVLVAGAPPAAAERALTGAPVLFGGRLGAGADERALACLDAATADEARALLPSDADVTWSVMPWFATEEIANLR